MKILAISGTEPISNVTTYLAWGSIALVTVALFWGTIRIRGSRAS